MGIALLTPTSLQEHYYSSEDPHWESLRRGANKDMFRSNKDEFLFCYARRRTCQKQNQRAEFGLYVDGHGDPSRHTEQVAWHTIHPLLPLRSDMSRPAISSKVSLETTYDATQGTRGDGSACVWGLSRQFSCSCLVVGFTLKSTS
jgi:hypothetical protein